MSSVEQDDSASQLNSGEENFGELVVSCRDGAKVLEFIEEALDEISFAVEREIASPRHLAIGFWRNHRGDPSLSQSVDQRIGVVSLVAKQGGWIGAADQWLRTSQVVGLSRCQHQFDRIAQGIDERVDLGRQSAAGSADRLRAVFFRAPALC